MISSRRLSTLGDNFLLRFSVVSFVVCLAIAVAFGFLLQQQLISDALDQQAQESATVVDTLLWNYLTAPELAHPAHGKHLSRLNLLVHRIKHQADRTIVRIKIWNSRGVVFYSDDPKILGRHFEVDEDLRAALNGHTSTSISDLSEPENVDERGLASQLLQTYVPIRAKRHATRVIGAYEIYRDMKAVQPRIDAIHRFVFFGVGGGFLVLYLSLFAMVRGASRRLARQARDIDEKAAENARLLNEAAEAAALREVDRLKDEFISVVSHELRRPLASIKGYAATLLLDHQWDEPTRREFLLVIDDESDRLAELIENLLDLSRLGTGMLTLNREPILLPRIARVACDRIAASAHVGPHRYSLDFPDQFPLVEADSERIKQVLLNLIENAAKYSPPNSEVSVRGRILPGKQAVELSVRDRGIGIAAENLERVFDRFYRVDNSLARRTQGTGLGLAICKGVIEAHEGRIWAESDDGGTIVYFTLPSGQVTRDAPLTAAGKS